MLVDHHCSLYVVNATLAIIEMQFFNLIVAIDHQKGNRSLPYVESVHHPYEEFISIARKASYAFNEDNWFSCFGFRDGPWDMKTFDDIIPSWPFDNLKFLKFVEIMNIVVFVQGNLMTDF